jgi:uncharacterized membrane protein (UPF0127 family)
MSKKSKKTIPHRVSSYKRYVILVCVFVLTFFSSIYGYRCLFQKICDNEVITKIVRSDLTILAPKGALTVEVVNTKLSREQGLSGRSQMKDNGGMLFIFDHVGKYGFWMKDMNFALDIVWIDDNGVVVSVERNLSPESYPKAFINNVDARYVLEVNAGVSEKIGLYLGSKVKFAD